MRAERTLERLVLRGAQTAPLLLAEKARGCACARSTHRVSNIRSMAQIAVVIPTRNRGAQAAEAASAVLSDSTDFELVVVDQSTDDATAEALRPLQGDPRLRVIRSQLRGASNARNAGVAATSSPLVAFTDDDCRP